jgi:heme O synthase-like polyprenyltransferase
VLELNGAVEFDDAYSLPGGDVYRDAAAALALGVGFFALAAGFARTRGVTAARRLFLGSVVYLPLVWTVMLLNH